MSVSKSDETLLSICILNFSFKNDFVWEEISNIRHSVSSGDETLHLMFDILLEGWWYHMVRLNKCINVGRVCWFQWLEWSYCGLFISFSEYHRPKMFVCRVPQISETSWRNGAAELHISVDLLCGTTAAELHNSVDLLCGTTAAENFERLVNVLKDSANTDR